MLQRAAKNAYSWWWASHIRIKQSKWLEQNLHDMEEKVDYILKIIDEDGDTFARRAEMYYRKRPELLNFVEDSFRSYRALAERFDHISKELQTANRTIATIYPERVQLSMDDEDGGESLSIPEEWNTSSSSSSPAPPDLSIPRVAKKNGKPSRLMSKKGLVGDDDNVSLGLSKDEAREEIDELQKWILALQTEREFVKSLYENGAKKYRDIENRINEIQARVYSLQDEFGIGCVIKDNEARSLMASTALKSCKESLARVRERQKKADLEADIEGRKVRNIKTEFDSLVATLQQKQPCEKKTKTHLEPNTEESRIEKIKEEVTHLMMPELAEKVDELVEKVIGLETAVSFQNAYVDRLKAEAEELQEHLRRVEDEKESLLRDSETTNRKIRELEKELQKVMNLNRTINDQSDYLRTRIAEASCRLDDLSVKLVNVLPDEERFQARNELSADNSNSAFSGVQMTKDNPKKDGNSVEIRAHETEPAARNAFVISGDELMEEKQTKEGNPEQGIHQCAKTRVEREEPATRNASAISEDELTEEKQMKERNSEQGIQQCTKTRAERDEPVDDQPNWKELFLNGLDERDKILLEEYISVLGNYRDAKKKLNEAEKRRRASHFQYVVQVKILRNSNALKDAEIQSLQKKLSSLQDDDSEAPVSNIEKSDSEAPISNIEKSNSDAADFKPPHRQTLSQLLDVSTAKEEAKSPGTKDDVVLEMPKVEFSAVKEKIHADIDELLEENIEFWHRFSNAVQQIRKFEAAAEDLHAELQNARDKAKQEENNNNNKPMPMSLLSEIRPIYRHMREVLTELMLWLEHNAVQKDDLQSRLSSLSNIEEEIRGLSEREKPELDMYQAAKFQGEVQNMKQENKKVASELQAGVERVHKLQDDITNTLAKLDEEYGIKKENSATCSRIPLRSFLFGVKMKKQRPSACVSPALQRQYSDLPIPQ